MNAIIVCGGLSTRLGEITKATPKVLLEIGGKPVLEWQIEKLKEIGVDTVILAAGHLSQVLQDTVGDTLHGVKIIYAIEKEKLGTGGAIRFAWNFVEKKDEPVIVMNGDVLTTIDLQKMVSVLKPESEGIILGTRVEDASSYGTLEYDEKYHLLSFKEKEGKVIPGYINGGMYVFTKHAFPYFPEGACSLEYDVFPHMKDLYVFESDEPWIDIGVPDRLAWAREHSNIFE
ncbi:MAG: sugar phosphate nucleotidyltransferase [Candidatus Magasanikbacteria bacterium]